VTSVIFLVVFPDTQVIVVLAFGRALIFFLEGLYPGFILILSFGRENPNPETSITMLLFFAETTLIAALDPPCSVCTETVRAVAASAGLVNPHKRAASLNGITAL